MALIYCTDCGKQISDKAKVCVHCGCPIEKLKKSRNKKFILLCSIVGGASVIVLFLIIFLVLTTTDENRLKNYLHLADSFDNSCNVDEFLKFTESSFNLIGLDEDVFKNADSLKYYEDLNMYSNLDNSSDYAKSCGFIMENGKLIRIVYLGTDAKEADNIFALFDGIIDKYGNPENIYLNGEIVDSIDDIGAEIPKVIGSDSIYYDKLDNVYHQGSDEITYSCEWNRIGRSNAYSLRAVKDATAKGRNNSTVFIWGFYKQ